ncbi:helix-turn-helix domain-containing protein [Zymomonas mobilis]|uniref:helix-turn-helix domain-containing protein n=1 Tax=Zymomonas mobilis TaxID=542 RepID=UPI0039E9E8FD
MANNTYDDIWDAFNIKPDKAKSLDIRSDLMIELTDFIEDKGFTQKKAAAFFGVSQPRISNLVHGRLSLFTIDFLVELCVKAGINVDVSISRKTEEVVEITEELEREVIVENSRELLSSQTQSETYNNQSNSSNNSMFLYFSSQTDMRKFMRIGELV